MSGLGSVRLCKSPETVAEGQNSSSRLASSGIQEVSMEQLSLFCGITLKVPDTSQHFLFPLKVKKGGFWSLAITNNLQNNATNNATPNH